MGRAPCCDKAAVKKGPWSPEEDSMLKNYIEEHGTGGNWIALPHKIGLKRCGKSCRLRWLNYLRPNIKHGDFTPEEDSIICSLYISIGSRWSIIAAQLPGRTDNDVKNYWNTKLKKRLLGRRKDQHRRSQSAAAVDELPDGDSTGERPLSASAMERIQLYMQLQNPALPVPVPVPVQHHNSSVLTWQQQQQQQTTAAQSNDSFNSSATSSSMNVTVAEHGRSTSQLSRHDRPLLTAGRQLESAATTASPSSADNSNVVVTIEAELQELLYGEGSQMRGGGAAVDGGVLQVDVDWWSYYQGKQSPVNSWDFTTPEETTSVFQDYTSVYDI
ncbi:hypothetical protein GUJ93_ZPchr0010g11113 [Zizania palustris]|uniref:Uncharacterized protein n=1 Tax=Zizania palustris TaxID=103762 RepID=A0A8J6BF97_ZIZPA|nr:hypothetical protein GUJ93_ZPchr0010g11113 [Zizania palustris]